MSRSPDTWLFLPVRCLSLEILSSGQTAARTCMLFLLQFFAVPSIMAEEPPATVPVAQQEEFFETRIRPLLATHCWSCHGEQKQQGSLRLDSREAVQKGNESGPVVVPGKPDDSRLWRVVQHLPDDVQMPPDGKLHEELLRQLQHWIQTGAYWPAADSPPTPVNSDPQTRKADGSFDFAKAAAKHWAWQQVRMPQVPQNSNPVFRTSIDQFIGQKLADKNLKMSAEADRWTLMRRLSFDLLGLPPAFDEVQQFLQDDAPLAYERLVDRWLASPHYGERWGRHWLDLARYADTKGYVFTENRFYPYSYTYRDYVIESLNADKPYDLFVTEQLAADRMGLAEKDPALAGMGFLTVGPRFLNSQPDIIDDRIDLVSRGLMGLTVGCARCHDHKYDPIPAQDYYSLYGIFDSSYEPELPPLVGEVDEAAAGYAVFQAELDKRVRELHDYVQQVHQEQLQLLQNRAGDCLQALMKSNHRVPAELEPRFSSDAPREQWIDRWGDYLIARVKLNDPQAVLLDALSKSPVEGFADECRSVISKFEQQAGVQPDTNISPLLMEELKSGQFSNSYDVAQAYGRALSKAAALDVTEHPDAAPLKKWLTGPGSVSDLTIENNRSPLFGRDHRDKARSLARQVDEWRVQSPEAPPRAMVLLDKETPVNPVVFQRGDPSRRGESVPRRPPRILNGGGDLQFESGSGRLELARFITSRENPLTARVIVNRVWMHHFGVGLVASGSDFGTRGLPPTHPELLDHLAWRLMHEWNWSLKSLHREILLSHVYRQSSSPEITVESRHTVAVDSENQFLWKQNRRRLEFEPYRDSLLDVAGVLEPRFGGRAVDFEEKSQATCRTIYGLIDRNNLPTLYRTFDFPAPDTSNPGRPNTTVPQQALFALNSQFVERCAASLASRVQANASAPDHQVVSLFEFALSRRPSDAEFLLFSQPLSTGTLTLEEICHAMLMSNEFLFVD